MGFSYSRKGVFCGFSGLLKFFNGFSGKKFINGYGHLIFEDSSILRVFKSVFRFFFKLLKNRKLMNFLKFNKII